MMQKIVSVENLGQNIYYLGFVKIPDTPAVNAAKLYFANLCKSGQLNSEVEQLCRERNADSTIGIYVDGKGQKFISGSTFNVLTETFLNASTGLDPNTKEIIRSTAKNALYYAQDISAYKNALRPL